MWTRLYSVWLCSSNNNLECRIMQNMQNVLFTGAQELCTCAHDMPCGMQIRMASVTTAVLQHIFLLIEGWSSASHHLCCSPPTGVLWHWECDALGKGKCDVTALSGALLCQFAQLESRLCYQKISLCKWLQGHTRPNRKTKYSFWH